MLNEDRHTTHGFQLLWHCFCPNCLHPLSCLSHILHPLPPSSFTQPSPCVFLLDLADNLAMDDFTFQEQLLTPRLATAGVGGVSSPAAPLWRSCLVPTFPIILALLQLCHHWPLALYHHLCRLWFNPNFVEQNTFFKSFQCKVQQFIKGSMNNNKEMPLFSLSVWARSCFVLFKITECFQQNY